MVNLWWIFASLMFGFIAGFLMGASATRGTAKAVAVALLIGGVFAIIVTFVKDIDLVGQFLFNFSGGSS